MNRFIRIVCFIMVVAVLLTTSVVAAENENQRASNYFGSHSVYLHKTSSTQFQAWFEVAAVAGMQKLGARTIEIQRSTDKSNWTTVATYEMEDYSNMVASNTGYHDGYVTYTYTTGYYYRAYVELYAKNSNGTAYYDAYTSYLDLR